ncbi:hypothetical protein ACERK3_17315 [Phycisphaerales bacterium AB-hyl4]|uniref:Uncharacterized protein n=1 Tax=Natronomicrosphaera hydrolytica TaxID=3242702 RepID=A0ABV4UBG3_9BACT
MLIRPGRTDYWEGVIHFCEPEEFAAIHRDDRIKACSTGYFKRPAVCLTEATQGNWSELQRVHGPFGYVFRKRQLIEIGGAPAIYMPYNLLEAQKVIGFSDKVKPFVNLLHLRSTDLSGPPRHDYLHEREWRVPHDIVFNNAEPFGVIVDWSQFSIATPNWEHVWSALMRFEELDGDGSPESVASTP